MKPAMAIFSSGSHLFVILSAKTACAFRICINFLCLLKILASTDFLSNRFSALCQSNTGLTEHYLAGLEKEKKINSVLPQRQQDENFPQGFPQGIVEGLGKYGLN